MLHHRKGHMAEHVDDYLADCVSVPTDLTFKVGEKSFPVHRVVLILRSPYFRRMLDGAFKEKDMGVIPLTGVDPDIFLEFLNLVYSCPYVSSIHLMAMIDMYGIKGVTLDSVHEAFAVEVEDFKEYIETCMTLHPAPVPPNVIDIVASKITSVEYFKDIPRDIWESVMTSNRMKVPRICEYIFVRGANKGQTCGRPTTGQNDKYCIVCQRKAINRVPTLKNTI